MYVEFGQRPYGKCDVVPELFYVATWFFHVNYVPLVPMGTRLVLGQSGKKYHVVRIPFSFKSLLFAWVRTACLAGIISFAIAALIAYSDHNRLEDALLLILLTAFCGILFAFFMIYPRRKMPSYERACRLAELAGLNDRAWAALNVLYNRDPLDRPNPSNFTTFR